MAEAFDGVDGRPLRLRALFFRAGRRFGGSEARRLRDHVAGHRSGVICDIRMPPSALRGVSVDREAWRVRYVAVAGAEVVVGAGTFQPFFLELQPGYHSVDLLDGGHRMVESKSFALGPDQVVTVRVFPPTTAALRTGSSTRELLTVETDVLSW